MWIVLCALAPARGGAEGRASDRQHHYVFAHRMMPRLFFRDAGKLTNALADRKTELLRAMWVDLGEQFFSTAQIAPEGLDVVVLDGPGEARIVVLVFPKPEASAEAYFAALVTKADGTLLYLTLEKAIDLFGTGESPTVFGGWDEDGGHLNYGEGSQPTVEEFGKLVRAFLEKPAPVNARFKPRQDAPQKSASRPGRE